MADIRLVTPFVRALFDAVEAAGGRMYYNSSMEQAMRQMDAQDEMGARQTLGMVAQMLESRGITIPDTKVFEQRYQPEYVAAWKAVTPPSITRPQAPIAVAAGRYDPALLRQYGSGGGVPPSPPKTWMWVAAGVAAVGALWYFKGRKGRKKR